jgi:hypothetical protein
MDEPRVSNDALQFEQADYGHDAPTALTCGACGREIGSVYYEAGGRTLCEMCRLALTSFQASRPGTIGVLKAIGAGLGAGVVGWLLYYGVLKLSGYEFGLIAIVVGWAVGRAVRWGSGGRGGWVYQTIAVIITYFTIVSTAVPVLFEAAREQAAKEVGAVTPATTPAPAASPGAPSAEAPAAAGSPGVALAWFVGFILILPFLQGFENIMGIAILGFGVFEAWRINKRLSIVVTGPFTPGRRSGA